MVTHMFLRLVKFEKEQFFFVFHITNVTFHPHHFPLQSHDRFNPIQFYGPYVLEHVIKLPFLFLRFLTYKAISKAINSYQTISHNSKAQNSCTCTSLNMCLPFKFGTIIAFSIRLLLCTSILMKQPSSKTNVELCKPIQKIIQ